MSSELLDRINQRKIFASFIQNASAAKAMQITGEKSGGKSEFVRYAANQVASSSFQWSTGIVVHRCFQSDKNNPLNLIHELVFSICKNYPNSLSVFFKSIDPSALAKASAKLIFDIAKDFVPFDDAFSKLGEFNSESIRTDSIKQITSSISEKQSLLRYVDHLFSLIPEDVDYLIIDDIHHADVESLKILFSLVGANNQNGVRLICSKGPEADQSYSDLFRDFFWRNSIDLEMRRLSIEECFVVFGQLNKEVTESLVRALYSKTQGNFGLLAEYFPLPENEFRMLASDVSDQIANPTNIGSQIDIDFLGPDLLEFRHLFALRVLLDHEVPDNLLPLVPGLESLFDNWVVPHEQIITSSIVSEIGLDRVQFTQRRLVFSSVFFERILQSFALVGDLDSLGSDLAKNFVQEIGNESNLDGNKDRMLSIVALDQPEIAISLIEKNLTKISANELTFEQLWNLGGLNGIVFDTDNALVRKFFVTLANYCHSQSQFTLALRLCPLEQIASLDLSDSLKILECAREVGLLRSMGEQRFEILEKQLGRKAENLNHRIQIANSLCPILEHRGEYEKIREIYLCLDLEISDDGCFDPTIMKFQLNRGLSVFHGEIIERLKTNEAQLSEQADEEPIRKILRSKCQNHLGLGYFYTGSYESAIEKFSACLASNEMIQRRIETPKINLAATYIMLGDYEQAKALLTDVLRMDYLPSYQKLTALLNASLTAFQLGQEQSAIEMIEPYLSGDKGVPDPSLDIKFGINRAYFHFRNEEWKDANRLYMKASKARYRFGQNRYQKTYEKLARFCAVKAGYVVSQNLDEFDFAFEDVSKKTIFEKPFIVDVNSLYIF